MSSDLRTQIPLFLRHPVYSGIMLTGTIPVNVDGKSVEVFVPSTGQQCELPDLPEPRYGHIQYKQTLCGGDDRDNISKSCISLDSGGKWVETTTLREDR